MRTSLLTTIGAFGFVSCLIPAVAAADEVAPTTPPPATAPSSTLPPAPPPSGAQAPGPSTTLSVAASGQVGPNLKGVSVWGILPWSGFGVGGRFMLPLPIQPLLRSPTVSDSFALEFGLDYLHWSYDFGIAGSGFSYSWTEVLPVVGIMWNIWLSPNFALYPKVEGGYAFGWFSGWQGTIGQPA